MTDQYIDGSGNKYEAFPELSGQIAQSARMKIEEVTLAKGVTTVQYFGKIPLGGIRIVGGSVNVTLTQGGSGTAVISIGTPTNVNAFAEFNNSAAGHATSFKKHFTKADSFFEVPVLEASDVAAGSPSVIAVKLEERNDVTGDTIKISGYIDLDFVNLATIEGRKVRDANGREDTDKGG